MTHPSRPTYGTNLTEVDYQNLASRSILRNLADAAGIRRVDSLTGRAMFSRKGGDLSGIIIPNQFPGENYVREYRLRLDNPELERRNDGTMRERGKYLQPSQRGNLLYFPPGLDPALLADPNVPAILTEGEFKALALYQACPAHLVIAVTGVYNFRGTIGKAVNANGKRVDVKGVISDFDRVTWKGRRIIIAFDTDVQDNPKVRSARWQLQETLIERGGEVGILEWPPDEGKGIDDRIAKVGPDRVLQDISAVEFGRWQDRLLRNEKGRLLASHENVALYLENSPEWRGVIAYNEFTGGVHVVKTPPSPITAVVGAELGDSFDTETTRWLERHGIMVSPDVVRRVVDAEARRNTFHPVREFLERLPAWDGKARIESWLIDYCRVGVSDANPSRYASEVGRRFLIAAVARVFEPGCKSDHLLVLEGTQGIGKSSAIRILAGEWYTDQLADPGSKDASMQLRGKWLIELAELSAVGRTETERLKAFFSAQTERFRLPYGRRVIEFPRQCVFVGTTNSESWLKDETGGRRFWPVKCAAPIDLSGLRKDRDQLWAEALHAYRVGAHWWLEDQDVIAEAHQEQSARYSEDVWHGRVIDAAELLRESLNGVSVSGILNQLRVDVAKQDQRSANRVATCLKLAGWERYRQRLSSGLEWRYRKATE